MSMTEKERAVQLVNHWIHEYRMWLKDGGGAAGVQAQPKEALIELIAEAFRQCRASQPPANRVGKEPEERVRRREPSKPKALQA
jgi:hypothetical protein